MSTDILDKTYKTSDNRLLFVYVDSFIPDRLEIRLGNIGRFPFYDENKCRRKLRNFIKELNAEEI